jgi:hypothetical protein
MIHRSTRPTSADSWATSETWNARFSRDGLIMTEGSTPFVVLTIPVSEGKTWNGNAYNNEINPNTNNGEDTYTLLDVKKPCLAGDASFADCVTVEQENNEEFVVYHDQRRETYASEVGLVFKEVIQLNYCNDADRNCVGMQIVDAGIRYKQTLVSYGKE